MIDQNRVVIGGLTVEFLLMEFTALVKKKHFYHPLGDRNILNCDFSANEVIGNIRPIFPDTQIGFCAFAKR